MKKLALLVLLVVVLAGCGDDKYIYTNTTPTFEHRSSITTVVTVVDPTFGHRSSNGVLIIYGPFVVRPYPK